MGFFDFHNRLANSLFYNKYKQNFRFPLVVPKPPVIRVHRVTSNSIALRWTSGDTGNSPIIAYRIKFKITYGEWEEKQVKKHVKVKKVTKLFFKRQIKLSMYTN
jgi:Fibronectin type III domain